MKNNDEYRKIYAKISGYRKKAVIGISSTERTNTSSISLKLARSICQVKKVLLIDLDNENSYDEKFANANGLLENREDFLEDKGLYRLNFTKSDDVELFLAKKEFIDLILDAKEKFDYILVNEKSINSSQFFFTKNFEDSKILLVKEGKTEKSDLHLAMEEIEKLGLDFLGVIYHK